MSAVPADKFFTSQSAIIAFLSFALAYFLSNVVRAITATLSPDLASEFNLNAGDLGLLAGGYFLGFFVMQLPLGKALDRYGAKRVLLAALVLALVGCAAFAVATGFTGLLIARVVIGVGVSACLMAPMTAYRQWFTSATQLRCNSWMLMTGALGMLGATLPVQWLLPLWGWRGIFGAIAAAFALALLLIYLGVPKALPLATQKVQSVGAENDGFSTVLKHPYFLRLWPMAFVYYGGVSAMQTLWVGPWLTQVAGLSPVASATGLFYMNVVMLFTFMAWGSLVPTLTRLGWGTNRLITAILPLSLLALASIVLRLEQTAWWQWALFLMLASPLALAQPTLAMQFPAQSAGRALTLFNLQIFSGSFFIQWGFGLVIDGLQNMGYAKLAAYQGALVLFLVACVLSYLWFVLRGKMQP